MIQDGDDPDAPFRDYRLMGTPEPKPAVSPQTPVKVRRAAKAGLKLARERIEAAKANSKPSAPRKRA